MKWFTEPNGKFVVAVPIEWQYKNVAANYEDKSPFCFGRYENDNGSFQISCYSLEELKQNPNVPVQKAGTVKLKFVTSFIGDDIFRTKLWFASVADHTFIIKYVYSIANEQSDDLKQELATAEQVLSTLQLLPVHQRELAVEIDKYEKFLAALGASFDIKNKALENDAVIEFMVITANQIDAYLRMALVLKKQLNTRTDKIDIALLYQGENDPVVMERKIYKQALDEGVIDQQLFDDLESLYKERNKVIHRYIITDFKTRTFYKIALEYDKIAEKARLALGKLEEQQALEGVGIHKSGKRDMDKITEEDRQFLYSQVNDKHLLKGLARPVETQNK